MVVPELPGLYTPEFELVLVFPVFQKEIHHWMIQVVALAAQCHHDLCAAESNMYNVKYAKGFYCRYFVHKDTNIVPTMLKQTLIIPYEFLF